MHDTLTFEQQVFRYKCARYVYKRALPEGVKSKTAWDVMCEVLFWSASRGLVVEMTEAIK